MNYSALKKEVSRDGPGRLYMLWGPEDYLIADFTVTLRQILIGQTEEADFHDLGREIMHPRFQNLLFGHAGYRSMFHADHLLSASIDDGGNGFVHQNAKTFRKKTTGPLRRDGPLLAMGLRRFILSQI